MTHTIKSESEWLAEKAKEYYQRYCNTGNEDFLDKAIVCAYKKNNIPYTHDNYISDFPVRVTLSSSFTSPINPNVHKPQREGFAVSESKDRKKYSVIWDGATTPQYYPKQFIQLL